MKKNGIFKPKFCFLNSLAFLAVFTFSNANAGFLDDIKNIGSDIARDVIKQKANEQVNDNEPVANQPESNKTAPQKPKYDQQLVADTQRQLNRLGYKVGAVDGLYGNGTRRAIEGYQKDQNLEVNGAPSQLLLSRMEVSATPAERSEQSPSVQKTSTNQSVVVTKKTEKPVSIVYETGTSNADFDVIGLRLGMSPDQAEQILNNYKKNLVFKSEKKSLEGHSRVDGSIHIDHRRIADTEYVASLTANDGHGNYGWNKGEWIALKFAAPPNKNKLISVIRHLQFENEGPQLNRLTKAFHAKYGGEMLPGYNQIARYINEEAVSDEYTNQCYKLVSGGGDKAYVGCGFVITNSVTYEQSTNIVKKVFTRMFDAQYFNDLQLKTTALVDQNNEQIRQDKIKESESRSTDSLF